MTKNKNPNKKGSIAAWITYVVLLAGTIVSVVFNSQIFGVKKGIDENGNILWDPPSIFAKTVSDNAVIQYLYGQAIPNLIRTVQIITIAITLGIIVHLLGKITFSNKRGLTVHRLITNFLKWVIAIAAAFFVMNAWGADTTMMIASAGVVTLIIGLGSQTLVADILAGIFIVFEGDFQVGDIVIIDGWRGEVIAIGIRTTKLIDAGGNIKIVSNSEIKNLINQTQELSVAKVYVAVSYGARIEHIESVISQNLDKIKAKIPAIEEGPFYKGVDELGESGVTLLFVAKCKEADIYQVQRDLNREIKIVFDDNNVEIPFNQLVIHTEEDNEELAKITRKERKTAEAFANEQKELSQDIEVKK